MQVVTGCICRPEKQFDFLSARTTLILFKVNSDRGYMLEIAVKR